MQYNEEGDGGLAAWRNDLSSWDFRLEQQQQQQPRDLMKQHPPPPFPHLSAAGDSLGASPPYSHHHQHQQQQQRQQHKWMLRHSGFSVERLCCSCCRRSTNEHTYESSSSDWESAIGEIALLATNERTGERTNERIKSSCDAFKTIINSFGAAVAAAVAHSSTDYEEKRERENKISGVKCNFHRRIHPSIRHSQSIGWGLV